MSVARIGIDLGGTAIKAGVAGGGTVLNRREVPTPSSFSECLAALAKLCKEVAGDAPIGFVGIGAPGVIGPDRRSILDAPNLRFLENQPLAEALGEELGCAAKLENDASAAALGEARHGAGRGLASFLMVTLGTGVGGGIVFGGELWRGAGGMAGEFGHLLTGHDRTCNCGSRGCLEAVASATALLELAAERGISCGTLRELADRARLGEGPERELFDMAGGCLGEALSLVALLLDIRHFLVGGGASAILDLLRPRALRTLGVRAFGRGADDFTLEEAQLGNDAGILGAASLD